MSSFSKFMDDAVNKYEQLGYSKLKLSQVIVASCLSAYVVRITYPVLSHQYKVLTRPDVRLERLQSTVSDYHHQGNGLDNNNTSPAKKKISPNASGESSSASSGDEDSGSGNNGVPSTRALDATKRIAEAELLIAQTIQKPTNIGLNWKFVQQLRQLVGIMVPRVMSREIGLLTVHTVCLISRTFLSIYVAAMEGAIVKFIVRRDVKNFVWMLIKWFGIAIPATFVNSMIRYLEQRLALAFRTRLVNHSYKLYFKNQTYYRVSNLDGRIENADHRLV